MSRRKLADRTIVLSSETRVNHASFSSAESTTANPCPVRNHADRGGTLPSMRYSPFHTEPTMGTAPANGVPRRRCRLPEVLFARVDIDDALQFGTMSADDYRKHVVCQCYVHFAGYMTMSEIWICPRLLAPSEPRVASCPTVNVTEVALPSQVTEVSPEAWAGLRVPVLGVKVV